LRVLDCKVPEDQATIECLPRLSEHLCAACRDHFAEVRHQLELLEIPYRLNDRLVRGLDYYVRTTFEVTSDLLGAQSSVLGGGRYDGLVKDLGGPDLPGIGFAVGLERLSLLLPARPAAARCQVFLLPLAEGALDRALRLQRALREAGVSVLLDPEARSFKSRMKQADKLGAGFVAILGQDELARQVWTVRDMARSTQEDVPEGRIVDYLKEKTNG
jgi:histidyl-tRNA synthetase